MRKNKNYLYLGFFVFLFGALLFAPHADAAVQYTLLEKIPFLNSTDGSDLNAYLGALYKLALTIVVLAAVLMVSIGGFMYLTSAGNTSSMASAKGVIFDAIIGLVIALFAWLILNVINPDLTNIKIQGLTLAPAPAQTATTTTQGLASPPTTDAAGYAAQILSNSNISVNSSGDCSSASGVVSPLKNLQDTKNGTQAAACYAGPSCAKQGSQGCADNAVRLDEKMLKALATVGTTYSFAITSLAGGPHAINSAHYLGKAADIVPTNRSQWQAALNALVANGAQAPAGNAKSMCEDVKGKNVGCDPGSGADHIHVVFP